MSERVSEARDIANAVERIRLAANEVDCRIEHGATMEQIRPAFTTLLHTIYDAEEKAETAALAASRVDTAEVERRAARKAFTKGVVWARSQSPVSMETVAEGFAREYPAPRECVLSWGTMSVDATGQYCVWNVWPVGRSAALLSVATSPWEHVRCFDDALAIKAFAAEVGQ